MVKKTIAKNVLLCAFALISANTGFSQDYTFTHFNAPYQELTNGTVLTACEEERPTVPVGFDFPLFQAMIDSVIVDLPFVYYHNAVVNGTPYGVQIFPFAAGYACNESSEVSYATVQENGHDVFIVQWKNLGFYNDTIGNQYINLQLKMYDADKALEVRFGSLHMVQENIYFSGQTGGGTYLAGIFNPDNEVSQIEPGSFELNGNPNNPYMVPFNDMSVGQVNGHPDSSMVYRFAPENAGLTEMKAINLRVTPNPVTSDYLQLQTSGTINRVTISDLNGQLVQSSQLPDDLSRISVAGLEKRVYLISVQSDSGTQTSRFIRQ